MDVSMIRSRLKIGPTAGVAWFSVDEIELAFARHKSPGHRAVVVRSWPDNGPLAWVFARSRTSSTGIQHAPHTHKSAYPHCWLEQSAKIVTDVPLTIKKSALDHNAAMCDEPDEATTKFLLTIPVSS